MNWLLLQLADSAFPAGGFAHSGGLEAALQQGEVRDLDEFERFLSEALWQTGHGALPLAASAHEFPDTLPALDERCDLFLSNHIANRASRVQGRAFFSTCKRSFENPEITKLAETIRPELHAGYRQHFAPVFGATLRALSVSRTEMQSLLLFATLRGIISSAIRLGVIGPYQGQRLQTRFAPKLDEILSRCAALQVSEIAQTAPLLDLFQSNHDRLYSRLFQS